MRAPAALPARLDGVPLAVQYLHQAQYLMPADALRHPGSRQFRRALHLLADSLPVRLLPSRDETRRALLTLDACGELAPWIDPEGLRR